MTLAEYPYVAVRIGCAICHRQGCYRLARMAERFGANAELTGVLATLAGNCRRRRGGREGAWSCGAAFIDVGRPGTPDLALRYAPELQARIDVFPDMGSVEVIARFNSGDFALACFKAAVLLYPDKAMDCVNDRHRLGSHMPNSAA